MSVTNLGNQIIHIQYGHEATSSYINKQWGTILKPGVLKGGLCSWIATDDIEIAPFVALVKTPTGELIKFETITAVPLTINLGQLYIVCNYTWISTSTNYLDFEVKTFAAINSTDVIIAKATYVNMPAFVVGTMNMSSGWDYTINEDFKVSYTGGGAHSGLGEKTITLTGNQGSKAAVIIEINSVIDASGYNSNIDPLIGDFYAYDAGGVFIGIRTSDVGPIESLTLSSGTVNTDALIALGITPAVYTGGNYPTIFDYSEQTYTWRSTSTTFEIKQDLSISGATTIEGDVVINGDVYAMGSITMFEDLNLLINRNGTTASAIGAGINIEGDGAAVVGYFRVDSIDNSLLTLKAPTGSILTLDINANKTCTIAGSLNIEADSIINQDVTTDADVTFNSVTCVAGVSFGTGASGTFTNTGLKIEDSVPGGETLQISPAENLTGNRVLLLNVNDGDKTLTLNTSITLNQNLETTDSPTFASITIGTSTPFADAAGTLTLQNVDLLDATTETTIEAAIDTLVNLTSIQGQTISLVNTLTVEAGGAAVLNQDLTTDASVTFGDVNIVTPANGYQVSGIKVVGAQGASITDPAVTASDLIDSTGIGVANGDHTFPAITNTDNVTDSTTGTANDDIQDVSTAFIGIGIGSAFTAVVDSNARNIMHNDNFKEIADQLITQRLINTNLANALATITVEYNALKVDVEANNSAIDFLITRLEVHGLIATI